MFCRRCGNQIPEGLGLCPNCGLETNVPWQPGASPSQSAPAAPPAAAVRSATYASSLSGVGGWLLFFCISFTILWPLWTLSQYAMFHFVFRGLGWLAPVRLILGFVVGVLLWTKNPTAMVLLRVYLGLGVLLTLWSLTNWLQVVARVHVNPFMMMSFMRGLVIPVIFLVAAILYFAQSERVRATYGSKLF